MILTNTKRPAKAERSLADERRHLVDEFGRLDRELAPLKTKQRRHEELARLIRSWHADVDPRTSVVSFGSEFEVVLGPRTMETRITDLRKVYRLLGRDRFLEIASITMRALGEKLNAEAVAALTVKEPTGYRPISVVETASETA